MSKVRHTCDCHPMTAEDQAIWERIRRGDCEPPTKEDWRFLHEVTEAYKRRLIDRVKVSERHKSRAGSAVGNSAGR